MADLNLEVGAFIDLSQILPGLETLASDTAATTARINENFANLSGFPASAIAGVTELEAKLLGLQGEQAAVQAALKQTQATIAASPGQVGGSIIEQKAKEQIASASIAQQITEAKLAIKAAIRNAVEQQQAQIAASTAATPPPVAVAETPAAAAPAAAPEPVVPVAATAEPVATTSQTNEAATSEDRLAVARDNVTKATREENEAASEFTAAISNESSSEQEIAAKETALGDARQRRIAAVRELESAQASESETNQASSASATRAADSEERLGTASAAAAIAAKNAGEAAAAEASALSTSAQAANVDAEAVSASADAHEIDAQAVAALTDSLLAKYVADNQALAATTAGMDALRQKAAAEAELTVIRRSQIGVTELSAEQEKLLNDARERAISVSRNLSDVNRTFLQQGQQSAVTASAAQMRMAEATVANKAAQADLQAVMQFASQAGTANVRVTNELAAAQERARIAAAELAAAEEAVVGTTQQAVSTWTVARTAEAAMTDSTFMLARGLGMAAAQSAVLGPIMQALFPVFLAVSFVEVLGQIYDHFEKIHEKALDVAEGWNKLDNTFESYDRNVQDKIEQEGIKVTGYTSGPLAALDEKIKTITFDVDSLNAHFDSVFDQLTKNVGGEGNVGFMHGLEQFVGLAGEGSQGVIDKAKEIRNQLEEADTPEEKLNVLERARRDIIQEQIALQEDYNNKKEAAAEQGITLLTPPPTQALNDWSRLLGIIVRANGEIQQGGELEKAQRKAAEAEGGKELETRGIANQRAFLEEEKKAGEEKVSTQQATARRLYEAGQISLEEEVRQLKAAEDQKLEIIRNYVEQSEALLRREAKGGENVAPKETELAGELASAENARQSAITEIDATAARERQQLAQEESAFWDKVKDDEIKAEVKSTTDRLAADRAYAAEAAKINSDVAIAAINAQEQELEGSKRMSELKIQNEDTTQTEKIRETERLNAEELRQMRTLEQRKIDEQLSLKEKEKAALLGGQSEADFLTGATPAQLQAILPQLQAIEGQIVLIRQQGAARIATINQQIKESDQRLADAQLAIAKTVSDRIAQDFTQAFQQIITRQQTVRMAFQLMGSAILTQIATTLEQMLVKWALHYALIELLQHSSIARQVTAFITGESLKKAVQTASDVAQVSGDAGRSYAAGFASVMEALPWPENMAVAPGVASGAAAATMAGGLAGAAEKGALLDRDMPIFAHAKEMILPAHLSAGIQGMISGSRLASAASPTHGVTDARGGGTMHQQFNIEVHNHGGSGMGKESVIEAVRMGVRRGQLG